MVDPITRPQAPASPKQDRPGQNDDNYNSELDSSPYRNGSENGIPKQDNTTGPVDISNLVYKTMPKPGSKAQFLRESGMGKPTPSAAPLNPPLAAPRAPGAGATSGQTVQQSQQQSQQNDAATSATVVAQSAARQNSEVSGYAGLGIYNPTDLDTKPDPLRGLKHFFAVNRKLLLVSLAALIAIIVVVVLALILVHNHQSPKNTCGAMTNCLAPAPITSNPTPVPIVDQKTSQIPDAWRLKYFGSTLCTNQDLCGDHADPDKDGLDNLAEYKLGTDPNNADSDGDGIADGDEVNVFNTDPLNSHTGGVLKYTDSGDIKYKYNSHTHQNFSDTDLKQIAANIKTFGLHSPTTKTLPADVLAFYTNYGGPQAYGISTQTLQSGAPAIAGKDGALDRDTQRSDAIRQISYALLKYYDANHAYPDTTDFSAMTSMIKASLSSRAVNTSDPVNVAPYVYGYQPKNAASDFAISYYSETQNQAVVISAADAKKYQLQDQANQRDNKRKSDLESIASSLEIYSSDHISMANPSQKVYPPKGTWKQSLAPKYITIIPLDPLTNVDYDYNVSVDNQSFSLSAALENPPTAKKGYLCTQDSCNVY